VTLGFLLLEPTLTKFSGGEILKGLVRPYVVVDPKLPKRIPLDNLLDSIQFRVEYPLMVLGGYEVEEERHVRYHLVER
jgi:hypothetical protein